mmetsp:Transcript_22571/g.56025  ORF Transcript_22571/g.56025 Transcript_22571/m.56025 type:complete len:140 (+) Transcript_22571:1415-1834(+)
MEFDQVYISYRRRCKIIQLPLTFPELKFAEDFEVYDLYSAGITKIFKALIGEDSACSKFGFLPCMATHSRASVGTLLSASYAERINSAANLILTDGNTLLDDDEIDMCSVLRMNEPFMEFMREHYPKVAGQTFNLTLSN